jgi:glycosyltransferase involved in cell wall biosynthesis
VLAEAVSRLRDVKLVHVGPIIDTDFPMNDPRFIHIRPVAQVQLAGYYAEADVFVLASFEEGLSTVQGQALASGLPLICTDRTGGADLAHTQTLRDRIHVVKHGDVEALASAIATLRDRITSGENLAAVSESDRQSLSWAAYAERYNDALQADLAHD